MHQNAEIAARMVTGRTSSLCSGHLTARIIQRKILRMNGFGFLQVNSNCWFSMWTEEDDHGPGIVTRQIIGMRNPADIFDLSKNKVGYFYNVCRKESNHIEELSSPDGGSISSRLWTMLSIYSCVHACPGLGKSLFRTTCPFCSQDFWLFYSGPVPARMLLQIEAF